VGWAAQLRVSISCKDAVLELRKVLEEDGGGGSLGRTTFGSKRGALEKNCPSFMAVYLGN
jgi:hypothetical protein